MIKFYFINFSKVGNFKTYRRITVIILNHKIKYYDILTFLVKRLRNYKMKKKIIYLIIIKIFTLWNKIKKKVILINIL